MDVEEKNQNLETPILGAFRWHNVTVNKVSINQFPHESGGHDRFYLVARAG